ncbi:unnamed protein product, partial [Urochloa humidicola]
ETPQSRCSQRGATFSAAGAVPPDHPAPAIVDLTHPQASKVAPVSLQPSSSRSPPNPAIQAAVGRTRRRIEVARNMEISPAYTPPEIYYGPSSVSPSDRTPFQEL